MKKYGAQVIIEREFTTQEAAQRWMDRVQASNAEIGTHVEQHLWVPGDK